MSINFVVFMLCSHNVKSEIALAEPHCLRIENVGKMPYMKRRRSLIMAAEPQERRSRRLEVRVPPSLHGRVSHAAALRGQTVAAFVTAAVQDAAQRAIEDAEVTRLNRDDFERLARALEVDAAPNQALRAAAARHRALASGEA
jgi:uncharacterized protein (DUF1778 family)